MSENVSYSFHVEILRLRKVRARLETDLLAHPNNSKVKDKIQEAEEEIEWYRAQMKKGWGHSPRWYGQ